MKISKNSENDMFLKFYKTQTALVTYFTKSTTKDDILKIFTQNFVQVRGYASLRGG